MMVSPNPNWEPPPPPPPTAPPPNPPEKPHHHTPTPTPTPPTLERLVCAARLVLVGVQLQGEAAVGALDVVVARVARHRQHLVVARRGADAAHQLALLGGGLRGGWGGVGGWGAARRVRRVRAPCRAEKRCAGRLKEAPVMEPGTERVDAEGR